MEFKVKDVSLAARGALLVDWASTHMPVLNQIKLRFEQEQPLKNAVVGACLHVTKETAV
ncbi:MAG: adenosylhomocysteinase, partial [Candidatus Bathyarchaeota archaeon]